MTGYHIRDIKRGEFGELSKVYEEIEEIKDAAEQGVKLMLLIELSDLLGAVEGYLEKHHQGITIEDLLKMKDVTKRAFKTGGRS
jgi:phosphoribosyl-ATP pyrophosphohydrolase